MPSTLRLEPWRKAAVTSRWPSRTRRCLAPLGSAIATSAWPSEIRSARLETVWIRIGGAAAAGAAAPRHSSAADTTHRRTSSTAAALHPHPGALTAVAKDQPRANDRRGAAEHEPDPTGPQVVALQFPGLPVDPERAQRRQDLNLR